MSVSQRIRAAAMPVLVALTLCGCTQGGLVHEATPESLVGTWSVAQTFDSPEQPYVSFTRNGSWSASDGCNRVYGEWNLGSDGSLSVSSGPQTGAVCDGMPLPGAVLAANRVDLRGGLLVLHGSSAADETELERTRDPLVGPQPLPIGYWAQSDAPGAPFLFIGSKGSFSGNDGCNTLTGPWEITDSGDIRFPATVATEMACEGVDTWLSDAVLGRAIGGVMTLESEDGTVLGELTARR